MIPLRLIRKSWELVVLSLMPRGREIPGSAAASAATPVNADSQDVCGMPIGQANSRKSISWCVMLRALVLTASIFFPCSSHAQIKAQLPEPPAELVEFIETNSVDFEFYRIPKLDQKYRAETRFHVDLKFQFRFQPRRMPVNGRWVNRAAVHLSNVEIQVQHLVLLPSEMAGTDIWQSDLIRHEFDHVRVSSDPRIPMLIRFLLDQIDVVDVATAESPNPPRAISRENVQQAIQGKIDEIVDAMSTLLQGNYDLLDETTTHGIRQSNLPDSFFSDLYTAGNLQQMNFAFSDEVASLLRQRKYRFASSP